MHRVNFALPRYMLTQYEELRYKTKWVVVLSDAGFAAYHAGLSLHYHTLLLLLLLSSQGWRRVTHTAVVLWRDRKTSLLFHITSWWLWCHSWIGGYVVVSWSVIGPCITVGWHLWDLKVRPNHIDTTAGIFLLVWHPHHYLVGLPRWIFIFH